jgi:hypothetical protein
MPLREIAEDAFLTLQSGAGGDCGCGLMALNGEFDLPQCSPGGSAGLIDNEAPRSGFAGWRCLS